MARRRTFISCVRCGHTNDDPCRWFSTTGDSVCKFLRPYLVHSFYCKWTITPWKKKNRINVILTESDRDNSITVKKSSTKSSVKLIIIIKTRLRFFSFWFECSPLFFRGRVKTRIGQGRKNHNILWARFNFGFLSILSINGIKT